MLRVIVLFVLAAIVVYEAVIFTLNLRAELRWGVAPALLRHRTSTLLIRSSTSLTPGLAGGSRHQFWGGVNLRHHPAKGGLHEPLLDAYKSAFRDQVKPDSHSPSDKGNERTNSLRSVLATPQLALQQGEWKINHRHRLCQCVTQQEGKVSSAQDTAMSCPHSSTGCDGEFDCNEKVQPGFWHLLALARLGTLTHAHDWHAKSPCSTIEDCATHGAVVVLVLL